MTQDAFARAVGVSRSLVQQKSQPGTHRLDRGQLTKLAELLKKEPQDVAEMLRPDGEADDALKAKTLLRELEPFARKGLVTAADLTPLNKAAASASDAARKKMNRKGKPAE